MEMPNLTGSAPEIVPDGPNTILLWRALEFGGVILADGRVGQYSGGWPRPEAERAVRAAIEAYGIRLAGCELGTR